MSSIVKIIDDVKPDEIYNLACPASPVHYQYDPVQTTKTSVHGAINMLGLAKRIKAKIFQASTSEVYGDPEVRPQTEDYWGNVNPVGPRGVYDEAKRFQEAITMAYHTYHKVETRIGTLEFVDGIPTKETADLVYDNLDFLRGVETFLNGIPAASVEALRRGQVSLGAGSSHQALIFDQLMDSNPLFLTGNTDTVYVSAFLDLQKDGPTVVEIPPNTGNIIRLCANTGCHLHLIEPLGFELDDKQLRRAGLDYHEWAQVRTYKTIDELKAGKNIYALSTRGQKYYHQAEFKEGDFLVFGPETRGLPEEYLNSLENEQVLRLPMLEHSRSLNLSNTVAIVTYEALRQNQFRGFT